jgi:hypothetical protein
MKAGLLFILGYAVSVLSLPHYDHGSHKNITIIYINSTTTICPTPTPSPSCLGQTENDNRSGAHSGHGSHGGHGGEGGRYSDGFTNTLTPTSIVSAKTASISTPIPTSTELALKRDWSLNPSDFSQLEPKKSCRMLYAKEELVLGSRT